MEQTSCFRGIAHEEINFCRPEETFVYNKVPFVVEAHVREGSFTEFPNGMRLPRCYHEVIGHLNAEG